MDIHYSSDGEQSGFMPLDVLMANFYENGVKVYEDDILNELKSRGWYEGIHDFGHYLILSCDKFPLIGNVAGQPAA